tara:strand:- start:155 stop:1486 length:1332 start_codon:yes stop_codon:yes gene_type:complete
MTKKQQILDLVKEYILEKRANESWSPGEDWLSYSGPVFDDREYVAAIDSLLDEWLIFGKKSRQFEMEFPYYMGKKHGSITNSGSSANLLAVTAAKSYFKLKNGDKFITPVVCFPTTVNPILQCNLKPVFVDVTLPDLNLNLDEVEKAVQEDPGIKGIMFAHVLGNPPDMDRLMQIVKDHDLIFIEDACDALGSLYDGKKLGSFGHISTCSFFPAHHMTMGEGGFVATNIGPLRKSIATFRDWGRACYCNTGKPGCVVSTTACGNRFQAWLPDLPEFTYDHRYVFEEVGYNLKPLELQAAMGLEQIKKLPMLDEARRINFKKLSDIFAPYGKYFHLPASNDKSDPNWFAYLLTIKEDAPFSRHEFVAHMEENKIQTRSYFSGNILYHPGYSHLKSDYGDLKEEFSNAHLVTTNSFFLGTFVGIDDKKIKYIKKIVDKFFEAKKE